MELLEAAYADLADFIVCVNLRTVFELLEAAYAGHADFIVCVKTINIPEMGKF